MLIRLVLCLAAAAPRGAGAQLRRDARTDWLASGNSEAEQYLRLLQLVDGQASYPWSLRAFSPNELHGLTPADGGPWGALSHAAPVAKHLTLFAPEGSVVYNSTFPYGSNDGPVWAGRGLTTSIVVGAVASYGPLDVQVAPEFFRAENQGFPLAANGETGAFAFGNARRVRDIDLPQRFGTVPYQRLVPGQTTVRLTFGGVSGGFSTANEFWGPAISDPFLLGNNAAGFEHLFFGTSHPIGVGSLKVHMRAIAGQLGQSDYSITGMVGRGRYLAGLVGVVTVSQLPGLEIGGGRLLHNFYDDSTVSLLQVVRPVLNGLLKSQRARALGTLDGGESDNQLASLFARWVFPRSGVEVFAEYGREDSAYDVRDLLEEPDHDASVLVGLQKAWKGAGGRLNLFRFESFNDRISHLDAVRPQSVAYVHTPITQGHTNYGELLGAPDGFGGAGQLISLDSYSSAGRTTLQYVRGARMQSLVGDRLLGDPPVDVIHALTFERLTFARHVDVLQTITLAYELNRDFVRDALNLKASAGLRAHW